MSIVERYDSSRKRPTCFRGISFFYYVSTFVLVYYPRDADLDESFHQDTKWHGTEKPYMSRILKTVLERQHAPECHLLIFTRATLC